MGLEFTVGAAIAVGIVPGREEHPVDVGKAPGLTEVKFLTGLIALRLFLFDGQVVRVGQAAVFSYSAGQIGAGGRLRVGNGGAVASSAVPARDAGLSHQPGDPAPAAGVTLTQQGGVDPRGP